MTTGAGVLSGGVGQIVYRTATTFTGFIADEHYSLDWLFDVDNQVAPDHAEFMPSVGAIVKGSTTYEWLLRHSDLLARPERWQEFYGDRPTFVFTTRTLAVPQGADVRFLRGPIADALPAIREAAGGRDIWVVGGGDLAGQFADAGALDRIELTIAPVALAAGAPLLPRRLEAARVSLIDVERYGQFAHLTYALRSDKSAQL